MCIGSSKTTPKTNIMKKIPWREYQNLHPVQKNHYPFWFVNEENQALLYTKEEEKQYKSALSKFKNKQPQW